MDKSLCKSRLDVVDENILEVITKTDHVFINDSNVHQIGENSSPNDNLKSTPIRVFGNAAVLAQYNGWWTLSLLVLRKPILAGLG